MLSWILEYIDQTLTYGKLAAITMFTTAGSSFINNDLMQQTVWIVTIVVNIGALIKADSPYRKLIKSVYIFLKNKYDEISKKLGRK